MDISFKTAVPSSLMHSFVVYVLEDEGQALQGSVSTDAGP